MAGLSWRRRKTPEKEKDDIMASAPAVHLHLGHEQRTSGSGGTHPHLHPVKQEVQADIPLAGAREVEEAVAKAAAAQDDWRRTPPEARRDILNRLADLLEANRTRLAEMAALDGGTTLMVGERGVDTSVGWTRDSAVWCEKIAGGARKSDGLGKGVSIGLYLGGHRS